MENDKASIVKKFRFLLILVIVTSLSVGFYVHQGKDINLTVDGKESDMVSYAKTVEDFLAREEVNFQTGAFINVSLNDELEKDMNIEIINPKSYIIKYGKSLADISSIYNTVEDILEEQGIELGELDYVEPDLSEKIAPGTTIEVFRVNEEMIVEESDIEFKEEVKTTDKLDKGVKRVAQKGQKGLKHTHIKAKYINHELVSSTIENEEIVEKPVTQIIEEGTRIKKKRPAAPSRNTASRSTTSRRIVSQNTASANRIQSSRKTIVMSATAYDLSYASTGKSPGDPGYGITASGMKAQPGVVAVDPNIIPLGTRLYIESLDGSSDYGNAIAGDTGGAIKGNRIDLFFSSQGAAKSFGRRSVKVHILN